MVTQQEIYEITAKPLISNVLSGYNGTVFAYGQTSSGKTHTMEVSFFLKFNMLILIFQGVVGDQVFQGIIPRAVKDLFEQISAADPSINFSVIVSYFEIYNVRILLFSKTFLIILFFRNVFATCWTVSRFVFLFEVLD